MSRDRIEEIDQLLFDAGVLVLSAKSNAARKAADDKIMEARVRLRQLRSGPTWDLDAAMLAALKSHLT